MLRARSLLLKAMVAAGVLATLAACDASSGALGPREHRASAPALRTSFDSLSGRPLGTSTTSSVAGDDETCRSGYQVAYREDGTPYCSPIE